MIFILQKLIKKPLYFMYLLKLLIHRSILLIKKNQQEIKYNQQK